jgi:hypothetical protein
MQSPRTERAGKFEAKWTIPYMVTEKTRLGAYYLSDIEGKVLQHSWNAKNPYRYFI